MKYLKVSLVLFICFAASVSYAQKSAKEVVIKTSAQCEHCKATIEKTVNAEKGVMQCNLNLCNQELTVTYDSKKTDSEKLKEAISKVGYDADDVPGSPKAYAQLPDCCKKPARERPKSTGGCCHH